MFRNFYAFDSPVPLDNTNCINSYAVAESRFFQTLMFQLMPKKRKKMNGLDKSKFIWKEPDIVAFWKSTEPDTDQQNFFPK